MAGAGRWWVKAAAVALVVSLGWLGSVASVRAEPGTTTAGAARSGAATPGAGKSGAAERSAARRDTTPGVTRSGIARPDGAPARDARTAGTRRICSAPQPGRMSCLAIARTDLAGGRSLREGVREQPPPGYGPADLQDAYRLPSASAGAGRTVAVISAYDNPNAESDLAIYRAQFGQPACTTENGCFRKVNQSGLASPLPEPDPEWAAESALDTQMISATCPNCRILLVEATSDRNADLLAAVVTAVALGAKFISNSYGTPEYPSQRIEGMLLNLAGVVMTVASGDSGYGVGFPASSPYVTAVGGTSLNRASNARGWTETAWVGSGSGCSGYEEKPEYQTDGGCAHRTVADVAAVADPQTGVAVYNTYQPPGAQPGWQVYGGTSAAAPIIAGVYALAGEPASGSRPSTYPYRSPSALFDIVSGSNGSCADRYLCAGAAGYDGPTGLGTPNGVNAFRLDDRYGRIEGTVRRAGDGRAVTGARVSVGTAGTVTGSDGRYSLLLPPGPHDVTVTAAGYRPGSRTGVTVTSGGSTTVDFSLAAVPTVRLTGTVWDGSGQGWPLYAKVTVAGVSGAQVSTDPVTGRYSLNLPGGTDYTLSVTARYPGYLDKEVEISLGDQNTVVDVALPVDDALCAAVGYQVRTSGLSERFDRSGTPSGWTVLDRTGGGGWTTTDTGERGNLTGGDGGFMIVDSDDLGEDRVQDTELRTPPVDLSDEAAPSIVFHSDYQAFRSAADVDLSLDGGGSWQNVWHRDEANDRGPSLAAIAIPQAAHRSGILVRFRYTGARGWWWQVDDVVVGTRSCQPADGGLLVGQVTDQRTGAAVNGATVRSVDRPAESVLTAATPDDPALGDGFYWMFFPLVGSHQFVAVRDGYGERTETAELTPGGVTRADFQLVAGRVTVSPATHVVGVPLGGAASVTLTVRNDGAVPAEVSLGARGTAGWLSVSPASLRVPPGTSGTVTVTLDTQRGSVAAPGRYPAQLTFTTDTPYQVDPVGITMSVAPPKGWGRVTGRVMGLACTGVPVPVGDATVQVVADTRRYTVRTGADGRYALWIDPRGGAATVTVLKGGWRPESTTTAVRSGTTSAVEWRLRGTGACDPAG